MPRIYSPESSIPSFPNANTPSGLGSRMAHKQVISLVKLGNRPPAQIDRQDDSSSFDNIAINLSLWSEKLPVFFVVKIFELNFQARARGRRHPELR